jgi:hypothetical protein
MKYISIGNSGLLKEVMENKKLCEYEKFYPFDRAISSISVINDCLLNGWNHFLDIGNPQTGLNNEDLVIFNEKFTDEYACLNAYQCLLYFFGMNINSNDDVKYELQRRIDTLMYEINNNDDLTFIFADECSLNVKEIRNRQDLHYAGLVEFVDILKTKYNKTNIKVLAFFVNTSFTNTAEISTYNLNIDEMYVSDSIQTANENSSIIFSRSVSAKLEEILNL